MARAGLEDRRQRLFRQDVSVEHKVSVAVSASRDEKFVGREDATLAERVLGEREQRLHLRLNFFIKACL